jgi:hypothetical protein
MSLLRQWFGPSRKEIWQDLCTQIEGTYVDGGMWKGDKVQAAHGEWTITLDTYVVSTGKATVSYTRLRAPYVNPDGFRFTVSRKGFFSELGKLLGMQDVDVGHAPFDEDFVIKGNDEAKLKALFDDEKLRQLLDAQPRVLFTVKDDEGYFGPHFPAGTDELSFMAVGIIKDTGQLKQLFALFSETLDQLCRMGSAYRDTPGVSL